MSRKQFNCAVVWFRRDLRLIDNAALSEACAVAETVIPLFVVDDDILSREDTGSARVLFLLDALRVLDENLHRIDGRLIIRRGKATAVVAEALDEFGADLLIFQREYEPFGRRRDDCVTQAAQSLGKTVRTHPGLCVSEPGDILSQSGKPYTVFSPYSKQWFRTAQSTPLVAPKSVRLPSGVRSEPLPDGHSLNIKNNQRFECGGETAAQKLLEKFASGGLTLYAEQRDLVSVAGTSLLSRHLHFGTVSARTVVDEVRGRPGAEAFLNEIAWRDFYFQILFHYPYVETGAFRQELSGIQWEDDEDHFQAWCSGMTGYPIVDAAMRQLNQEAWMHNRARMIVASFLTKDLLINWQKGERYFMLKLVDGDLAANNGGWQWAAGTGTDAQPYFRIFNPVTQGEKFDPNGDYVRRYVPELRKLPNAVIHTPWKLTTLEQKAVGCVLGKDYPGPIVDHSVQRERTLALYRAVGERN